MSLDISSLDALHDALTRLSTSFNTLPNHDADTLDDAGREVLAQVAERLTDNYPYHHPLYAGQMLKPPHPLARTAYQLAMWLNPNNHALDGGRASSAMEKEAVADLAHMFGWTESLGHLCGGGTMANLEALWVAGQQRPGTILASSQAHYTHGRISGVLGLGFAAVPVDPRGAMDVAALERTLASGGVGTVVATLGTTGFGAVDPLPEILALRDQYEFRLHVDAAYGGYFTLADNLDEAARAAFASAGAADSIVIDPHKHGLQPYGCGCVLFADPNVGRLYQHDSPYTYFTSNELHLGEITLECSRAGASAVALWATHQLLPPVRGGQFAANLSRCRTAALGLYHFIDKSPDYLPLMVPALDIVVWAPQGATTSAISARSAALFDAAAGHDLHLALLSVPVDIARAHWRDTVRYDTETVVCLRSTLMKPEHATWLPEIESILTHLARR